MKEVAREMAISLATLTRKIKGLVNMTPTKFLRTIRLKKAKDLLLSGHGNISEIAFEVGFNSLSYFTKCYKNQFGITPSQDRSPQQY
jgi:AraC-like DNA-binding protein